MTPDQQGATPPDGEDFDGRTTFLNALRSAKSIGTACRDAKLSRKYVTARREVDETFRADWEEALLDGADHLEDEARRIATGGDETVETTTRSGKRTTRRTYDGALLRFLLKGAKPNVYGAHPRAGRSEAREAISDDADPPRSDRGSDR